MDFLMEINADDQDLHFYDGSTGHNSHKTEDRDQV